MSEAAPRELPSEAEVFGWFDSLSNWGRWGNDPSSGDHQSAEGFVIMDEMGTVGERTEYLGVIIDTVEQAGFPEIEDLNRGVGGKPFWVRDPQSMQPLASIYGWK
jgi:hypothetical protein